MRRLSVILFLLTLLSIDARTISGVVLSDNDSTALAGASCRILENDQFVTGTSADAQGEFSIHSDIKTSIYLEISMPGFNSTSVLIEAGTKNINIGKVYLSEGISLNEVTVTANPVTHSQGKMIVYPSGTDVKASSTAISLFQKLPLAGLQANPISRTLSVDGGTPMILINGIPSAIEDVQALQPKNIAKIEFSRTTPARYADQGKNGLISITLKEQKDGGQIFAWGRSAVATPFIDANIRGSYHQGPSQFTLYYSPSWRNYHQVYDSSTESYIGDDFRVNFVENDRNPFNYFTQNIRFKYDYSPSINTLFSVTFRAMPSRNKSQAFVNTEDSELGDYESHHENRSRSFTPSLDIFFRRDFNDKNSLEVQVVGTLGSDKYRRDNHYEFADGREENYRVDADSKRKSLISEISYIHNFSDRTSFSAGYQNTVSHSTNTYLTSDYKPVLTENNNYVYARLGQQVGKVYLSLATGAKLFWIENDLNKRNYIRNLSSARLSWNINQKWNVSANFQYSPAIPSLTALTDYPQQVSPYLISNGNPDLKVTEKFLYTLSAGYQYKKFSASFYSAFADTKNSVISNVVYLGDKLFLSQSVNARKNKIFQNDLSLKINGLSGFGANLSLSLTNYETGDVDWSHHLTSFDASLNLWWNKGPFTVSYWRKFPGKYLSGHVVSKDENGDALSFKYQPDKHWDIGIDWMYMFDSKGTRYPSWDYSNVNPSIRERYIKHNANMVVVSAVYSADFGSIFRSGRRSLNNSDTGSSLLKL